MVQFCYLRLYLVIETVSCRLVQQMAGMEMDWNLKKLVLMLCLQKSPQDVPLDEISMISSS